jgi:hypothetical protein
LIYIFLHQQWKQDLEFTLAKLGEICKYLAGACNSNSHARGLHYLTFVCKTKQGKTNATRRVVLRKCIKRAQRYQFALKWEEVPLQMEFTTLPPKNHNLFVKLGTKRELDNNAQYDTQGGGGQMGQEIGGGAGRSFSKKYKLAG